MVLFTFHIPVQEPGFVKRLLVFCPGLVMLFFASLSLSNHLSEEVS